MIDLTFVQECVSDTEDEVRSSIDMIYIKHKMIQEYASNSDDESLRCYLESTNVPVGSNKTFDLFSFSNDHIIRAIKHFNKAYAELEISGKKSEYNIKKKEIEEGKLTLKSDYHELNKPSAEMIKDLRTKFLVRGGHFEKGFKELEKQFDCNFKIYLSQASGTGTVISKFPPDAPVNKITISKKKGFQLGGLPITINVNPAQILAIVPSNKKLFGQTLTAILLHEIYHNIVHCVDIRNKNLHNDIKKTFMNMTGNEDKKTVDSKSKGLISRFKSAFSIKDMEFNEERSRNRFYVLSKIKDNPNAMRKFENDIKENVDKTETEKEMDVYIKQLQTIKFFTGIRKGVRIVATACAILLAGLGFVFGSTLMAATGIVYLAIVALTMLIKKVLSLFSVSVGLQEEYFCDLFAAMYNLPIHITSYKRQIQLNKMNREKVKQIRDLNSDISSNVSDVHPMTFDRELVSYQTAKQILDSGRHIKPEIKKYLKYIVKQHEGINDIEQKHTRQQIKQMDPEAAKDLQRTVDDFVRQTGVAVTESFIDEVEDVILDYYLDVEDGD